MDNNKNKEALIYADARWHGTHGIGRFSQEVISRLQQTETLTNGPKPLSFNNLVWLPYHLNKNKNKYRVYFNPGFNPILHSPIPFVLTIHDLIHLRFPGKAALAKHWYYHQFIKPAVKKAEKIVTVSEYSKKNILEWSNISEEKISVVGSGVGKQFSHQGEKHQLGYPYLLHVGNSKPHKNVARLIEAFAVAKIDNGMRLVLTGQLTNELKSLIKKYHLEKRVIFCGPLSDNELANYYRGAQALVFPSLEEGFGLPPLEAMSCGIPVLTSNISSLPEVSGDAAVYCDPYQIDSIAHGIETIVYNDSLRIDVVNKGFERIKLFSWERTANLVQKLL